MFFTLLLTKVPPSTILKESLQRMRLLLRETMEWQREKLHQRVTPLYCTLHNVLCWIPHSPFQSTLTWKTTKQKQNPKQRNVLKLIDVSRR